MTLQAVIDRLESLGCAPKKNCTGYVAKCPCHDDGSPSLSVREGRDGKVLAYCFAGCDYKAIAEALELPRGGKNTIIAEYDYTDETGTLLFQCVRLAPTLEEPKPFRQRRPDGAGGWIWKLDGVRRVLYRLPELLEVNDGAWVFIVEGEKDTDTLRRIGIPATCNPMGAGKWGKVESEPLHRFRCCIIGDKDEPGRKHAEDVRASLTGKAVEVRVLELPGERVKDGTDWVRAGGTAEALYALAKAASTKTAGTSVSQRERDEQGWAIKPASALVGGGAFDWVWNGVAARRYTTMLSGYWKCGKSTLLMHVVRNMASGGIVGSEIFPGRVLIVSEESEDGWARRRDEYELGDHIDFIIRPFRGRPTQQQWEAFAEHLAEAVKANDYALVIVDTLSAVSPTDDENDAAGMTMALRPFNLIADAGAAVLVIHHAKKDQGTRYTRSRGSGAIAAFFDQLVSFTPMEAENPHDRRRVIDSFGRLPVPDDEAEIVIELDLDGSGYTTIGNKSAARRGDRHQVIADLLAASSIAMTPKQIWEVWPKGGIPRPSQRIIVDDLAAGEKANKYVSAIAPAAGGRGGRNTRAYHLSTSEQSIRNVLHTERSDWIGSKQSERCAPNGSDWIGGEA